MSSSQQTPLTVEGIRAEVVNGIEPLAKRPELRVTDPAFVDPIIAEVIKDGGRDRADVIWKAQSEIERKLVEPDGLAQIEKLVAAHYANPDITKQGDVVTVDVGVVIGKLGVSNRFIYLRESPVLDKGSWVTAEIARFLKLGIAKYPDASEYDVTIVIPQGRGSRPDWKYGYFPKQGIIRIFKQDFRAAAYVLKNVDPDLSTLSALSPSDFKVE
jgi:hypothetical protein